MCREEQSRDGEGGLETPETWEAINAEDLIPCPSHGWVTRAYKAPGYPLYPVISTQNFLSVWQMGIITQAAHCERLLQHKCQENSQ